MPNNLIRFAGYFIGAFLGAVASEYVILRLGGDAPQPDNSNSEGESTEPVTPVSDS